MLSKDYTIIVQRATLSRYKISFQRISIEIGCKIYQNLSRNCEVLSHDVASGSDITPCNKIDKSLVVYRFLGNVMTFIITLHKRWQNLDVFMPKLQFSINFNVM